MKAAVASIAITLGFLAAIGFAAYASSSHTAMPPIEVLEAVVDTPDFTVWRITKTGCRPMIVTVSKTHHPIAVWSD